MTLFGKDGPGKFLVVHPPEFGHWRHNMMEDLAILTGGKLLARDLGDSLDNINQSLGDFRHRRFARRGVIVP